MKDMIYWNSLEVIKIGTKKSFVSTKKVVCDSSISLLKSRPSRACELKSGVFTLFRK